MSKKRININPDQANDPEVLKQHGIGKEIAHFNLAAYKTLDGEHIATKIDLNGKSEVMKSLLRSAIREDEDLEELLLEVLAGEDRDDEFVGMGTSEIVKALELLIEAIKGKDLDVCPRCGERHD